MLKMARLLTHPTPARRDAPFRRQGRSERRAEEVQTALRVGSSPIGWILANGKAPTVLSTSENLNRYVEDFDEPRTTHGKRRVSARLGWAGEKSDFFSILGGGHKKTLPSRSDEKVGGTDGRKPD
jgi:hypothetical protein